MDFLFPGKLTSTVECKTNRAISLPSIQRRPGKDGFRLPISALRTGEKVIGFSGKR
jgi:hypothetical protein